MLKNKKINPNYFTGKLLIATPLLNGSCFEKSVVYLCAHNDTGAMGILVNLTLNNMKYSDLLKEVGIRNSEIHCSELPIYFGGPVEAGKGFILHTNDYHSFNTQLIKDNISLTSTVDILKDMAVGRGPNKKIIALGCAGWGPGQIEKEIKENAWITISANENLVFGENNKYKWQQAIDSLGIDMAMLSHVVGNA